MATLSGHQGVIFNIDYSARTQLLFSTSDDRSINVWKLELEEIESVKKVNHASLLTRFYGHDARVWKCCNFIDNVTNIQYLCSIGEDLNCCLWNVDEKVLLYRFNAMRKGSKNIWSLCLNRNKMELITGWADGGLRRFALKSYLKRPEDEDNFSNADLCEWNLNTENPSDFIRNIMFLSEKIVCCTNLGYLYLIDSDSESNSNSQNQHLLLKNDLLANYNAMAKLKLEYTSASNWLLAVGTLKGYIFLIDLKQSSKGNADVDCFDSLSKERELTPSLNITGNSSKICSLIWLTHQDSATLNQNRYFLLGMLRGVQPTFLLKTGLYNFANEQFLYICR